jgi:hypothetical protein
VADPPARTPREESGGPLLYGDTNVIVGITSFWLNENCKGTNFFYRTDIANTQNLVNQYLFPWRLVTSLEGRKSKGRSYLRSDPSPST